MARSRNGASTMSSGNRAGRRTSASSSRCGLVRVDARSRSPASRGARASARSARRGSTTSFTAETNTSVTVRRRDQRLRVRRRGARRARDDHRDVGDHDVALPEQRALEPDEVAASAQVAEQTPADDLRHDEGHDVVAPAVSAAHERPHPRGQVPVRRARPAVGRLRAREAPTTVAQASGTSPSRRA